jgi:hypothetical protein
MELTELQQQVRELAAIGALEQDIAAQVQLPLKKLKRVFKRELADGAAEGKTRILRTLHEIAASGENTQALLFWVKARCGWRDTGHPSDGSVTLIPRVVINREQP